MDPGENDEARVLDPEEYTQKRRLRDVFDARRRVAEWEREARNLRMQQGVNEQQERHYILSAVQSYLREIEPMMLETYPEIGEEYWKDVDLGSVEIPPPESLAPENAGSVHSEIISVEEAAEPQQASLAGIGSLLGRDVWVSAQFEARVMKRGGDGEVPEVGTNTVLLPRRIIMKAFRQANVFLSEVGLDLDPDDERPMNNLSWGE
ncbi:hypothetical protein B9G49_13410 [Halorubrum sp. SD683]|nr:hypothetical protein B9G49_13410 [Halorubrum sp. SD683]